MLRCENISLLKNESLSQSTLGRRNITGTHSIKYHRLLLAKSFPLDHLKIAALYPYQHEAIHSSPMDLKRSSSSCSRDAFIGSGQGNESIPTVMYHTRKFPTRTKKVHLSTLLLSALVTVINYLHFSASLCNLIEQKYFHS